MDEKIDSTIGTALVVVALIDLGINAAVAKAVSQGGVSHPDKTEFLRLFLRTFSLSLTMTVAVVVLVAPRILGSDSGWWWASIFVIAIGAPLSGLTTGSSSGTTIWNHAVDSLHAFATHYGPAFFSGEIVGLGAGIVVGLALQDSREKRAIKRVGPDGHRQIKDQARVASADSKSAEKLERATLFNNKPPLAWGAHVSVLAVAVFALDAIAIQALPDSRDPNPRLPSPSELATAIRQDAETELINRINPNVLTNCTPTVSRIQSSIAVGCTSRNLGPDRRPLVTQFASVDSARNYMMTRSLEVRGDGSCEAGEDSAGEWRNGHVTIGRLVCRKDTDGFYMTWSYDLTGVVVRAQSTDTQALYQWWYDSAYTLLTPNG